LSGIWEEELQSAIGGEEQVACKEEGEKEDVEISTGLQQRRERGCCNIKTGTG